MHHAARVRTLEAVVRWYLREYHRTRRDLGGSQMFCDRTRMGHFAVAPAAFRAGRPAALFKMLVATTLFQRRRDQHVFRILGGLTRLQVDGLTRPQALLTEVARCPCAFTKTSEALHSECDLAKDPRTKRGTCSRAPSVGCPAKEHTRLLRRYGDFGKMPSSAALMLRDEGVRDLAHLRRQVLRQADEPAARAALLEGAVTRVWRVSNKVAAMFLSAVANPDLGHLPGPWSSGIDWTRYVVVDSNVDHFLDGLSYRWTASYGARLEVIRKLARDVPLDKMQPGLHTFNPRLVQQAMYMFMSESNRRANPEDCMHMGGDACRACPRDLSRLCPVASR